MNRSEAQRQLSALAQAVREGKAVTPDDYPVLGERTDQDIPLWQLTGAHITSENWSEGRIASWYEHEAIDALILDDEEQPGLR